MAIKSASRFQHVFEVIPTCWSMSLDMHYSFYFKLIALGVHTKLNSKLTLFRMSFNFKKCTFFCKKTLSVTVVLTSSISRIFFYFCAVSIVTQITPYNKGHKNYKKFHEEIIITLLNTKTIQNIIFCVPGHV
jgi:hypothetical protein